MKERRQRREMLKVRRCRRPFIPYADGDVDMVDAPAQSDVSDKDESAEQDEPLDGIGSTGGGLLLRPCTVNSGDVVVGAFQTTTSPNPCPALQSEGHSTWSDLSSVPDSGQLECRETRCGSTLNGICVDIHGEPRHRNPCPLIPKGMKPKPISSSHYCADRQRSTRPESATALSTPLVPMDSVFGD